MQDDTLIKQKLDRAQNRGQFAVMDLFSGCGGLTLGFQRAGNICVSAIELNETAAKSHEINFKPAAPAGQYRVLGDITKVSPSEAITHLVSKDEHLDSPIDLIIGGPPCQPFSRLGRAALWKLNDDKQAHINDERASLFQHFLKYIAQLKPIAFVLENVIDMGRFGETNVAEEIAVTADELGYNTRYTLLNAVWYGVPQLRERMIIIGIHNSLGITPSFPKITYRYMIPVGYNTSRSVQGKVVVLPPADHYVAHGTYADNLHDAVTVTEAFGDLAPITFHLDSGIKKHGKRKDTEMTYTGEPNRYTGNLRNWQGFMSNGHYIGNMIRITPRDFETFRKMTENSMYPEAVRVALEIFEDRRKLYKQETGVDLLEGSAEWKRLYDETVPPYDVDRYPNKFRKLAAREPARTVPAHLGKDTYSHIHFDSEQARGISVREAARLQSFPDAFVFKGSMNEQFTQIGNAVPPLMAYAIAANLNTQLGLNVKLEPVVEIGAVETGQNHE